MNIRFFTRLFFIALSFAGNTSFAQTKYQKDFIEFWTDINNHYAYLEQQIEKIANDNEFIRFLENVLNELHNGHSSLNTNLNTSN